MARAVTDLGEATAHDFSAVNGGEEAATCQTIVHIPGANFDVQNMPSRITDAAAPFDGCDDVGDAPCVMNRMYSPPLKLKM